MEIIVIRGEGDKQALTIFDPLLATVPVGLSRGRSFIDDNSTYPQQETVLIKYTSGLRIGMLIEIVDNLSGASWRGKLIGISHSRNSPELKITSTLELDRRIEV